jgi:hypothetical protein
LTTGPSFFIGYLPAPPDVRRFAIVAFVFLIAAFGSAAALLGRTPTEVGATRFIDELSISGVLVARPYPVIVAQPDAAHPLGRTIMLGGDGKRGVQNFATALNSLEARAQGALIKRGDLDLLLVGPQDVKVGGPAPAPIATPLGRWRLYGEICDGKCAAGGMAPGAGLAHKACANLCVEGGLPPVLVSSGAVEGSDFLLLADSDGGPTPAIDDFVAVPVVLEGDVERLGDMLIFRVDWRKARRL